MLAYIILYRHTGVPMGKMTTTQVTTVVLEDERPTKGNIQHL